jgi:hypothetical protein
VEASEQFGCSHAAARRDPGIVAGGALANAALLRSDD